MAKSLKSLLSKINLVDLAVVLVLVAVMMCLMKKMDVVEGLCGLSRAGRENIQEKIQNGEWTISEQEMAVSCSSYDDSECSSSIIRDNVEMCSTANVAAGRDTTTINIPLTEARRDNPDIKCEFGCCTEFSSYPVEVMQSIEECSECTDSLCPNREYIEPDCIFNIDAWFDSGMPGEPGELTVASCSNYDPSDCESQYTLGVVGSSPPTRIPACCRRSQEQMRRGQTGGTKLNVCEN